MLFSRNISLSCSWGRKETFSIIYYHLLKSIRGTHGKFALFKSHVFHNHLHATHSTCSAHCLRLCSTGGWNHVVPKQERRRQPLGTSFEMRTRHAKVEKYHSSTLGNQQCVATRTHAQPMHSNFWKPMRPVRNGNPRVQHWE